jgi:hypothetical protein
VELSLSAKQREAVAHLARARTKRAIAWWRVGEGKTRIALAWAAAIFPGRAPRVLIICSPGAIRTWKDEITLLGAAVEATFLSYGALSNGKAENRAVDFEALDALIIDELWMYKSARSKRSQRVAELSRALPTIGLSGSMITARNIEDLWGQAKAVGLAETIARNLTAFRREFTIESINSLYGNLRFIERQPKPGAVEAISGRLAENIHVHFPKETRETRDIFCDVEPSREQVTIRRALAREYYFAHENPDDQHGFTVEVKSAAALLVKLQQVSDGSVKNQDGASLLVDSPKSKKFREIVCELLDGGERVLVWVAFKRSLELLRGILPGPVALLSAEHPFDAKAWSSGAARICIATVGSGASLNDFAGVRYAIFYSSPFSHLQNQQARGRTLRMSSDSQGRVYYHLCTEGFPDRRVLDTIAASRSAEDEAIEITRQVVTEAMREK